MNYSKQTFLNVIDRKTPEMILINYFDLSLISQSLPD